MFVCGVVVGALVVSFGVIAISVVMGGDKYE